MSRQRRHSANRWHLNPDLPIAHKFYAQLESDLGRASDAMVRLLTRARDTRDPEILAALISPLRYCGFLEASAAAYTRALALEPKIRTSIAHTWFLQRDYERVSSTRIEDNPYIVGMSLAEVGRSSDALPILRSLEDRTKTRMRDFITAARTMIEGDSKGSVAAVGRVIDSGFSDPEGLFYLSRHLARLNQVTAAQDLLERVVDGGFFCYPTMNSDPWLNTICEMPQFSTLLAQAKQQHEAATREFERVEGYRTLGIGTPPIIA